jgi:single-strand DNA-binding protein
MSAKVTIIGNLGRNPETRINANNTFIANFSIAVNHQRRSGGSEVKQTDWYNITATGRQAEVLAEHARKGDPLLVEGKQTVNPWTDREGNARVSVDVLVQDFRFLGMGASRSSNAEPETAPESAPATSSIPEDIREELAALSPPEDFDYSGVNFPSVM